MRVTVFVRYLSTSNGAIARDGIQLPPNCADPDGKVGRPMVEKCSHSTEQTTHVWLHQLLIGDDRPAGVLRVNDNQTVL